MRPKVSIASTAAISIALGSQTGQTGCRIQAYRYPPSFVTIFYFVVDIFCNCRHIVPVYVSNGQIENTEENHAPRDHLR